MSAGELWRLDAWAMAAAVRGRELSAAELLDAHLERIEREDPAIGAVWLVTEARARAEASAVDAAIARGEDPGRLAGVPVGWKDLIDTGGTTTTYGSALYRDHVPKRDADVVARLAAAGAVTVAKLSLHELAWGTTNENPHFGVCRNPHDHRRMPGGSSGGSAAALAAGMVALAPGTDTGGSIRCPASCCGVVGLKPTYGRVSLAGIRPLCQSFDHAGPIARSVRDCALALELMAGPSARDPRTPPVAVDGYVDALERGVRGLTVGVAERYFFEYTNADVAAPVRRCIEALEEAGARIVPFDLGWPPPAALDGGFYESEQAATMLEFWPHGRPLMGADVAADVERAFARDAVSEAAVRLRRLEYAAATLARAGEAKVDVVVHPSQAFPPPPLGTRRLAFAGHPDVDVTVAMCGLTEVYDVLGWPAISVPAGTDSLGLPVGCQLAALPWRESDLLATAAVVEASAPRMALPV